MSARIPGRSALIHFAAGDSGKGLKRPPKTMVGWDKAQGDRESTPEARGSEQGLSVGGSRDPEGRKDTQSPRTKT